MRVLLTGASGFIGSRVAWLLGGSTHEVTALSASSIEGMRTIDARGYEFGHEYLKAVCPDIEVIVHVGAFIPKVGGEVNDIDGSTSNIIYTKALLDAAAELENLRRFIFISTVDVYADSEMPIDEQSPTAPATLYGQSKLYCEHMTSAWALKHGVSRMILRLGHVYGEGEEKYRKAMPVMIENALAERDLTIYGDGEAIRSYIYVDDVANAIVCAIDSDSTDIVNVVSGECVTINRLAKMILELSGAGVGIDYVPSDIPNRNLRFDNHRLLDTLLNKTTSLNDGLAKEIAYLRGLRA